MILEKKMDNFKETIVKKVLTTINSMPHQFFAAGLQARNICSELKKLVLRRTVERVMGRIFHNKM